MANSGDSNIVPEATTIVIGSWVYTANVSGGFTRRLANPEELEAPTPARRNSVDDFVDQLDKVPLPAHIETQSNPNLPRNWKRIWMNYSKLESRKAVRPVEVFIAGLA